MAKGREWTTSEIAYLRQHYPAGTPVCAIARALNRTEDAVKRRARELGLIHPGRSSQQCIANFEAVHGKPLVEIAREYRDHCLSRKALAHDIGIETKALREALGRELWDGWPFMTIGRLDANKMRQKAPCLFGTSCRYPEQSTPAGHGKWAAVRITGSAALGGYRNLLCGYRLHLGIDGEDHSLP